MGVEGPILNRLRWILHQLTPSSIIRSPWAMAWLLWGRVCRARHRQPFRHSNPMVGVCRSTSEHGRADTGDGQQCRHGGGAANVPPGIFDLMRRARGYHRSSVLAEFTAAAAASGDGNDIRKQLAEDMTNYSVLTSKTWAQKQSSNGERRKCAAMIGLQELARNDG